MIAVVVLLLLGPCSGRVADETNPVARVGEVPKPAMSDAGVRERTFAGHMCISVSSTQRASPGYSFDAANLIDGNLETSWQARSRASDGAWFKIELPIEARLSALLVANGFQTHDKLGDEFINNSRIARARIQFDDKTERVISFEATARGMVRFDLDAKVSRSVTVFVERLHDGTKWRDLAVSELEVFYWDDGQEMPAKRACGDVPRGGTTASNVSSDPRIGAGGLMFNHADGRWEDLRGQPLKTTAAIDGCTKVAVAASELCERCSATGHSEEVEGLDPYYQCWNTIGGLRCINAKTVPAGFRLDRCLNWLGATACDAYRSASWRLAAKCGRWPELQDRSISVDSQVPAVRTDAEVPVDAPTSNAAPQDASPTLGIQDPFASESPQAPPPQNVPPTLLEGNRISGDAKIIPNDDTKAEIQRSGKTNVIGSFKLCVTIGGDVSSIKVLKSTGLAAYDAKIQAEIQNWRYRPYEVNGHAVPVCTAVTFVYTQR